MLLNFKQYGQGEPIVILHGLFGTLDNWQTIAKALSDQFMVFALDLRNHGRSPHSTDFSYRLMAEDVLTFMEQQWIHNAHLVGHSMGGKVAMQLALEHPDRVNRLVVVDIAPKAYEGGHHEIFEAMFSLDLENLHHRNDIDAALATKIPDYGVRQFLLKNLTKNKAGGYRWKMNLDVLYAHYEYILEEIKSDEPFENPTLFLRGERSNYVLDEDFEHLQRLFPEARLATVPKAGHWVHAEAPDDFLKAVSQFLV